MVLEPGTRLYDFPHELMAQDISLFHSGNEAIEQVQIGATNGGGCYSDNGIA
jgi:hypothetical protein